MMTQMTTTTFRIDLMDCCMGMKRFTSQSNTPTTIRVITTFKSGMMCLQRYRAEPGGDANLTDPTGRETTVV